MSRMSKFRKKPVVVEAEQYSRQRHLDEGYVPEGVTKNPLINDDGFLYEGVPYVETLEGQMTVRDGDWIIAGVQGEHYPCKPDIFKATYEPMGENHNA